MTKIYQKFLTFYLVADKITNLTLVGNILENQAINFRKLKCFFLNFLKFNGLTVNKLDNRKWLRIEIHNTDVQQQFIKFSNFQQTF